MKLSIILSGLLSLSATTLAVPTLTKVVNGKTKKYTSLPRHGLNPVIPSNTSDETITNSHWSGAVLTGDDYKTVTGTVVVPTFPKGGSTETYGAAWVGIDGYTCNNLWQTGFSWYVLGDEIEILPWYEWYPEDSSGRWIDDRSFHPFSELLTIEL
jgi:hypothetical protein